MAFQLGGEEEEEKERVEPSLALFLEGISQYSTLLYILGADSEGSTSVL